MKLTKKLMAIALVVAMAVCMLPMGKASKVDAAEVGTAELGSKVVDGLTTTYTFTQVGSQEQLSTTDTLFGITGNNVYYGGSNDLYVYKSGELYIPVTPETPGSITFVASFGSNTYYLLAENGTKVYMNSNGSSVEYSAEDAEDGWVCFTTDPTNSPDNQFKLTSIVVTEEDPTLLPGNIGDYSWNISADLTETIQGTSTTWEGLKVDATSGKLGVNNASWAQLNSGTIIGVPVDGDCEITVVGYSADYTVDGDAATAGEQTFTYEGEAGYVNVVATANTYIQSISTVHTEASDEDTVGTTQGDMYVQYKEQQDGKFTLRFVVPVPVNSIDDLDGAGVSMTVNAHTEVVTGKDLFTSVWANSQIVYAPNEYAFAVVELTNVPADTVFTEVMPAYVSETGETTYGGSFSYSLIAED